MNDPNPMENNDTRFPRIPVSITCIYNPYPKSCKVLIPNDVTFHTRLEINWSAITVLYVWRLIGVLSQYFIS